MTASPPTDPLKQQTFHRSTCEQFLYWNSPIHLLLFWYERFLLHYYEKRWKDEISLKSGKTWSQILESSKFSEYSQRYQTCFSKSEDLECFFPQPLLLNCALNEKFRNNSPVRYPRLHSVHSWRGNSRGREGVPFPICSDPPLVFNFSSLAAESIRWERTTELVKFHLKLLGLLLWYCSAGNFMYHHPNLPNYYCFFLLKANFSIFFYFEKFSLLVQHDSLKVKKRLFHWCKNKTYSSDDGRKELFHSKEFFQFFFANEDGWEIPGKATVGNWVCNKIYQPNLCMSI